MHPRTLIISPHVFGFHDGTGVTFSNLFAGWPKNAIANLHSSSQEPDNSVCSNFYNMSHQEIRRLLPSKRSKGANANQGFAASSNRSEAQFWQKHIVGNSGIPQKFIMTAELNAWLDTIQPEIIYTTLGPIPHMEACLEIAKKYSTPIVVHFMDDWYHQAYTTGIFRYQRKKMLRLFHSIVEKSAAHLTICDQMSDEFSRRYKIKPHAFQNTIDVKNFASSIKKYQQRLPQKTARRILYFGSVLPFAQLEAIISFARVLNKLNETSNTSHTLRVVTSKDCLNACGEALIKTPGVELIEIDGEKEQFAKELANAEILLLPANFSQSSEQMLRYSMPTKIPGYLASGVPVLVYAPASIAQTIYAQTSGWGLCVTGDERQCEAAIKELCENEELRSELIKKALIAVEKNHDTSVVRTNFQTLLQQVARKTKA